VFAAVGLFVVHASSIPSSMSAHGDRKVVGISWTETTGSDGRTTRTCYPTAAFTVGGSQYSAPARVGLSTCPWVEGESVVVRYDPSRPSSAAIETGTESTKWTPWIFVGAGALIALSGLVHLISGGAALGAGVLLLRRGLRRR
jgi:hypothetical protein